jgi:MFS family permease
VTDGRRAGEGAAAPEAPWAPLRYRLYRALWSAALVSNIGTWMQTVGAQWLLVDRPNASTLVALVQTASMLPVVLLAMPSGVLADIFDRRRLLIAVQAFQAAIGLVLAALTVGGQVTPTVLLAFTFALGVGTALTLPASQALIPEFVPRDQLPAASALGGVSANLARAIGPAIAGVLVAHVGVAAVFTLNAATFGVYAIVLLTLRHPGDPEIGPPERFVPALRAGGRFIRHSLVVRRIMLRLALFVVPAVALWALLPVVARHRLGLGAPGYGMLLTALGAGAVAGAFALPRLRAWLSPNQLVTVASVIFMETLVVLVTVREVPLVVILLIPAGGAWITVTSTINAALQVYLPAWVRARGLSTYQIVDAAGMALGSFFWGVVAQKFGLTTAYFAAAALLGLGAATIPVLPLHDTRGQDRSPAVYWPEPELTINPEPRTGPVLVETTYVVPKEREEPFLEAMKDVRRVRLRTGATTWDLYREGEIPNSFVEVYAVPSWEEHLRQHGGRLTGADREYEARAVALAEPDPVVVHLFPADRVR